MRNSKIKEFSVKLYESSVFGRAMEDGVHPGGLKLAKRMAQVARVHEDSKVLDIASGRGTTALFLCKEYGCRVIGLDLSQRAISIARGKAGVEHLLGKANFTVADAEALPYKDSSFDVVISECSFSLLLKKKNAAKDFRRVLKSGGKLVISDVILRGKISEELRTIETFASCIAGAMRLEDYIELFEDAGFKNPYTEDHSEELKRTVYKLITTYGSMEGFLADLNYFSSSAEVWQRLFKEGKPGYALIALTKP